MDEHMKLIKRDEYDVVLNSFATYKAIAKLVKEKPIIFPWTDENSTQFDILLCLPSSLGKLAGGLRGTDLFVSVMRLGAFGFELHSEDIHPSYYAEKLRIGGGPTSEAFGKLINGVRRYILENK